MYLSYEPVASSFCGRLCYPYYQILDKESSGEPVISCRSRGLHEVLNCKKIAMESLVKAKKDYIMSDPEKHKPDIERIDRALAACESCDFSQPFISKIFFPQKT